MKTFFLVCFHCGHVNEFISGEEDIGFTICEWCYFVLTEKAKYTRYYFGRTEEVLND